MSADAPQTPAVSASAGETSPEALAPSAGDGRAAGTAAPPAPDGQTAKIGRAHV